jgi:hypothetical protein
MIVQWHLHFVKTGRVEMLYKRGDLTHAVQVVLDGANSVNEDSKATTSWQLFQSDVEAGHRSLSIQIRIPTTSSVSGG